MSRDNARPILVDERRIKIMARKTFFASSGPVDQVGKAFMVLGQGIRRCLVCDETFTRQAAAAHAITVCYPRTRELAIGIGGNCATR